MVTPYAQGRFGPDASAIAWSTVRALRRRGQLLYLKQEDRVLAGIAALPVERELWLPVLGIAEGDVDLLNTGVIAALISLATVWGRRSGIRLLDFGRTPALVSDGRATYKRKWGLVPAPEPLSPLLALRVAPGATQDLLERALGRELIVA
jgi:hypothetical protein